MCIAYRPPLVYVGFCDCSVLAVAQVGVPERDNVICSRRFDTGGIATVWRVVRSRGLTAQEAAKKGWGEGGGEREALLS